MSPIININLMFINFVKVQRPTMPIKVMYYNVYVLCEGHSIMLLVIILKLLVKYFKHFWRRSASAPYCSNCHRAVIL
jgi:hypothetical protein